MMQQDVLGSVAQKILLAVTPNRQWNVPEQTDWVIKAVWSGSLFSLLRTGQVGRGGIVKAW